MAASLRRWRTMTLTGHAPRVIRREDFLEELAVAVPESGDVVAVSFVEDFGPIEVRTSA
jgi:hypothetical protein